MDAWFYVLSVARSGGGSAFHGSAQPDVNPATIAGLPSSVETSVIRYPAGIGAESFAVLIPAGNQIYGFEIRHVGFGIFRGYDDQGNETANYTANDTWFLTTLAFITENRRLRAGVTAGTHRSQIESYLSYAFTVSAGMIYTFPKLDLSVSTGIRNAGLVLRTYTHVEQELPRTVYMGVSKKLRYLPALVSFELSRRANGGAPRGALSASFLVSPELSLIAGVSSTRFDQTTDFLVKNYISSVGFGFIYTLRELSIKTATHFIGPGGMVAAVGVGMRF